MAEELKTGIAELDEALSGKGKRSLFLFAGRSSGKSATNELLSEALRKGGGTVSVEMELVPLDDPPDKQNMP